MTEQEMTDGMSALAWLGVVFAAVALALGVAGPLRPVHNLTRLAGKPTGAGAAQAELELRFDRGGRSAHDERRRRVEARAELA